MIENYELELLQEGVRTSAILKEVLTGLSKAQKALPPKLLYDKRGSELFEKICLLEEYYPTRAESEILQAYSGEMASLIGPGALVLEPGSGAGEKIRYLLRHLQEPRAYVPIEISRDILLRMSQELQEEFPLLDVYPVCGDFFNDVPMPPSFSKSPGKKVLFFPGSTIGNLTPSEAVLFLKKYSRIIGPGGGVLIGVDLKKDPESFHKAYNDSEGVTAEFNLNLLEGINREAFGQFNPDNFSHHAYYNEKLNRVEMHLVSQMAQLVKVHQTVFRFRRGETIHTESSYKYSVDGFTELGAKARLKLQKCWKDRKELFCVYYFERE